MCGNGRVNEPYQRHDTQDLEPCLGVWSRASLTTSAINFHPYNNSVSVIGRKSNKWSMVTYRLALAVFIRSPAAYEALKSFKLLQLPSRQSLQHYTRAHLDGPGIRDGYIQEQEQNYRLFQNNESKANRPRPLGKGVLIFDEVKVIGKVMWNTSNHKMYGLALTADEMTSLSDIFVKNGKGDYTAKTQYMMQFYWRDLTANFDVLGPYFPSSRQMGHNTITTCVLNTIEVFNKYGFITSVLVCDGSSSNLATVKLLCSETSGAYGSRPDISDQHDIKCWFENPFQSSSNIYFIICPTHQMKNMINALYSSSQCRAKAFVKTEGGQTFGWKAIADLYEREVRRSEMNICRRVPKLKWEYIVRDSWTKLNVVPAKIMQQETVLSELVSYCSPDVGTPPDDSESVLEVWKYLTACNKLFEHGFLSSRHVKTLEDDVVLGNINDGYKYFVEWFDELSECQNFTPTSTSESRFLAWQTWDLLRVCMYGFKAFCQDFLTEHPGYYIIPVRINGSAIETLFSQFKFSAGSKLSSVNYETAVRAFKMKKCIHGTFAAAKGMRDIPLHAREVKLKRVK